MSANFEEQTEETPDFTEEGGEETFEQETQGQEGFQEEGGQEEPTIEGLQAQLGTLQTESDGYKKAYEVLDSFGGIEGFEPIKPIVDAVVTSDGASLAQSLQQIDEDLFFDIAWRGVMQAPVAAAAALLKDPNVRAQVLGQDPEYQAYLQAKASGQPFGQQPQQSALPKIDLSQLDEADPLRAVYQIAEAQGKQIADLTQKLNGNTQQFQQQQQETLKAQREQRAAEAEQNVGHEFAQEITKVVKWSSDPAKNQEYQQMIFNQVNVALKNDAAAAAAFKRVKDLAAAGKTALIPGAMKVLKGKFNVALQKEIAKFNPVFKGAANNLKQTHSQQQGIRNLPPGSGAQPRASGSPNVGKHDGTREATVNNTVAAFNKMFPDGKVRFGN